MFAVRKRLFAEWLECVQQFTNTSSDFQNKTTQRMQQIGDLESCFSAEQTLLCAHSTYSGKVPGEQGGLLYLRR